MGLSSLLPLVSPLKADHQNNNNWYRTRLKLLKYNNNGLTRRFLVFPSCNFTCLRLTALPQTQFHDDQYDNDDADDNDSQGNTSTIISACFVGLLTGISVVIFNNVVHEIRDFCWDGIPYRGASWLREEPTGEVWKKIVFVPACGGLVVGMFNYIRGDLKNPVEGVLTSRIKDVLEPIVRTLAACVTLGTGNSLGPEGPSVEIGSSIAKEVGILFDKGSQSKLSLTAAGSAAGIASGFNAAVAGCFFAIESVLWPSPAQTSLSLTNTTSMVILSAVIASVVSEIGLGSEPAFTVPGYDFRSPSELPLYLLLGILCGLVSLILSKCTSFMVASFDNVHENLGIRKDVFPVFGGLATGLIALQYPEILYWGFDNVDLLLESRPFMKTLSADLLLQLVVVKIIATSLCRASGLVGGYYAPSLFIGAATGMAYGKFVSFAISQSNPIFHLSLLEVASPQAYGLVGMAATLAGVCQVTQSEKIFLLLLKSKRDTNLQKNNRIHLPANHDTDKDMTELAKRILVSEAMRTQYVTVLMSTFLAEAVTEMLAAKQSCAVIINDKSQLAGLLTLEDIQVFSKLSKGERKWTKELLVSDLLSSGDEICEIENASILLAELLQPENPYAGSPHQNNPTINSLIPRFFLHSNIRLIVNITRF
ncbi:Chloride channel protein [Heracleum sosnowskyi]|uniref:Chloride channel protein n=1 Tax=Heracleum sosnowskyi TaxID=360622 RepID=A0AAD8I672_9APIA|nr:Chloride channel protein [Heracleum sosnowskyi]